MNEIKLTMNAGEALYVHDALTRRATEAYVRWRKSMETNAPADEQAICLGSVQIVNKLLARLSADLFPPCQWGDCDGVADGGIYCRTHTAFQQAAMA